MARQPKKFVAVKALSKRSSGAFVVQNGISEASFYKYKSKYGGMELSDAKKLKALEDENNRLKKMVADLMLDNTMLRDVNSKKW